MLAFQRYQLAFTAHIRAPKLHPKPEKVVDRRMAVYREIVFNNIASSVSACFPVCQQVLGPRRWRQLCRSFFAHYPCKTPLFREIPQAFLDHLAKTTGLPDYITQLAHYEWVELMLSAQVENTTAHLSEKPDFLNEHPILAPVHQLLAYDYPVQTISTRFKPKNMEKTFLLLFRTTAFKIKFIVLSPTTYWLLDTLQNQAVTGKQALTQLAAEIKHPDMAALIELGLSILHDLHQAQALIGSIKLEKRIT